MSESLSVELTQRQDYLHSLGQNSYFYRALAEGNIMGTRCRQCASTFVPPRPLCPADGSRTDQLAVGNLGTLIGFTELSHRPSYAPSGPESLTLGLVQLDGVSTAILAEIVDAQQLEVGQRVGANFRPASNHPAQHLSFAALESSVSNQEEGTQ